MRILSVRGSSLSPVYRIRTVEVDGLTEPVPILVAEGAATKAVDDLHRRHDAVPGSAGMSLERPMRGRQATSSIMATSSSTAYPCARANSTSSRTLWMTAPRSGVPATVIPRRRRSSSSPSSLKQPQRAQHGVGVDAEHGREVRAGGSRSPGFASPSAIARRIWAATWR